MNTMRKEEARILIALAEGRAPKRYTSTTILDLMCMGWITKYGEVTKHGRQALLVWARVYPHT